MNTQQLIVQTIDEKKHDAFLMSLNDEQFEIHRQALEAYVNSTYKTHMITLAISDIDAFQEEYDSIVTFMKVAKCKSYLKELKASVLEEIVSIIF